MSPRVFRSSLGVSLTDTKEPLPSGGKITSTLLMSWPQLPTTPSQTDLTHLSDSVTPILFIYSTLRFPHVTLWRVPFVFQGQNLVQRYRCHLENSPPFLSRSSRILLPGNTYPSWSPETSRRHSPVSRLDGRTLWQPLALSFFVFLKVEYRWWRWCLCHPEPLVVGGNVVLLYRFEFYEKGLKGRGLLRYSHFQCSIYNVL